MKTLSKILLAMVISTNVYSSESIDIMIFNEENGYWGIHELYTSILTIYNEENGYWGDQNHDNIDIMTGYQPISNSDYWGEY